MYLKSVFFSDLIFILLLNMQAKVNVAGPSARTIRRHIEDSGFSKETDIQVRITKKKCLEYSAF